MPKLTIAPLAMPNTISMNAYKCILSTKTNGKKLFLQTVKHPAAYWVNDESIPYESMDSLYDTVDDFDELNQAIANKLLCGEDVVYAVCGRGISKELLECIKSLADANNTNIEVMASSGYAEAAGATLGTTLNNCCICTANSIPANIDVYAPLAIEEIDNAITAGEVKLKLSEFYPDDCDITFAYTDNEGEYTCESIKLYELDRQKHYFATTVVIMRAYSFLELERYGTAGVEEIMHTLRAPGGCPWDIKQTHQSLKASLIEEAYEVLDAIEQEDEVALCEELGDLLLHIVFHIQIETEKSAFTMRDVCTGLVKKLIFRHPHVFADAEGINTSGDVLKTWAELKKVEKKQETQSDVLKAVPYSFPALMRSSKVQKRAADVGFDFANAQEALVKVDEELLEVKEAMASNDKDAMFDELGDLLFATVNVLRLSKLDSELALKNATDKFLARFFKMEELIKKDGKSFEEMSVSEMDIYWNASKSQLALQ